MSFAKGRLRFFVLIGPVCYLAGCQSNSHRVCGLPEHRRPTADHLKSDKFALHFVMQNNAKTALSDCFYKIFGIHEVVEGNGEEREKER